MRWAKIKQGDLLTLKGWRYEDEGYPRYYYVQSQRLENKNKTEYFTIIELTLESSGKINTIDEKRLYPGIHSAKAYKVRDGKLKRRVLKHLMLERI